MDNTDDDSYITTVEWLRQLNDNRIVYYHNETNLGMFGNWNRGIELSSGKWFVILNDDDMLESDFLSQMMKCKELAPSNVGMIGCNHKDLIFGHEKKDSILKRFIQKVYKKRIIRILPKDMYLGSYITLVGALISKKVAYEIGGFNDDYYPTSDFVFIINTIYSGYEIYLYPQKLATYRIERNESLKFHTIEMFLLHENEIKIQIQNQEHYLGNKISDIFRKVSMMEREKGYIKNWLNDEKTISSEINIVNLKLGLDSDYTFFRFIYRFYSKLRYICFRLFRESIDMAAENRKQRRPKKSGDC